MFDQFSDGYCPECMLDEYTQSNGMGIKMILNLMDLWECPRCHLEAKGDASFMVCRERGTGQYKRELIYSTEYVHGGLLVKEGESHLESDGAFENEENFSIFIAEHVAKPSEPKGSPTQLKQRVLYKDKIGSTSYTVTEIEWFDRTSRFVVHSSESIYAFTNPSKDLADKVKLQGENILETPSELKELLLNLGMLKSDIEKIWLF